MKLYVYLFLEFGIPYDVRVFPDLKKAIAYRNERMKCYGVNPEDYEIDGHEEFDFYIEEVEYPED